VYSNLKSRITSFAGATAIIAGLLAFCPSLTVAQETGPIKVGLLLSTTGPAAYIGEPGLKSVQLYVRKLNEAGGVLGRKIELISYDDASEAAKANTLAKRLIDSDKVDVILGATTTGSAMALIPLVEAGETPLITWAGGISIIDPVQKWVFKTSHTDRMAAERVFTDLKKRGITKVALLTETSGFGQSGRAEAQRSASSYGLTVVADETFAPKDGDMTAQLTKVRGSAAQALFIFGTNPAASIATKNFRQLGIKLPLYHAHGVASKDLLRLAGDAANGVRLPTTALLVAGSMSATDPQYPVVSGYVNEYRRAYNEDAQPYGAFGHDALMLFVDAVKRAGSTDRRKVRDAIERTNGLMGTAGPVVMTKTDHMGLALSSFRLLEVVDGNFKLLE
jgi:branched-chain amino acid transport system substrate-binding protein